MTNPAPGGRFGPYEVIAAIGAGGMGEVYRALKVVSRVSPHAFVAQAGSGNLAAC